ncbi:MAG: lysophospholipid acyltransferase family protein [Candidatus Caldatribacteriota bacterium]|jgi:1-acyl-sn-glycerol-3-phosphate acyltransferase|nr:lysophospholipid acyltransferase family protein [Atribacterota bacterium]MDD3030992.1 lysophospholipid acyltransferase family protein [Atribacterota bacterium]MDD3640748.1 lysophospholipid acyltransferase family protein [Atribacterota bacterium]MDD4288880.1 lysophospholipid acyltransferase family protein [Atribacterota bacterium]MDD4764266.1 lysophospholipid acyltransferase family protein [Atribacterota bacterium]
MFYKIARFIGYILSLLFWPIEIRGGNDFHHNGPLILAANHVSYLDPIALAIAFKRQIYFLAKKEVFDNPFLGLIVKGLGAIPVDRKNVSPVTIKKTYSILKNGNVLGIFPEGTRSLNGELLDFNKGMIKIALKTSSPIIPVGIAGTNDIYPPKAKFPSFWGRKKITVSFGDPIYLDSNKNKDDNYQNNSLLVIKHNIKHLLEGI